MIKEYLSIVIPCKNEEFYILKTLESIQQQNFSNELQIIIADAQSTDKTRELINQFKKTSSLNIKIIEGGPVSYGRNAGAKLVTTDWILFMDADSILFNKNTLVESVYQTFKGNLLITCKQQATVKNFKLSIILWIFNLVQRFMSETFSTGVYMMVNRKEFEKLGGFNEALHQSEDYIFSRQIPKNKFKILKLTVGQDDRRYKKIGYFGMIKLVILNWFNRNNLDHFKKDTNYWV